MHIVQRRFSAWFNKRHDRRGTLWQGCFGSTLIEPSGEALRKTTAYIDLNRHGRRSQGLPLVRLRRSRSG
jgi:hypothetical protein